MTSKIVYYRNKNGLTQTELAEKLHCSQAEIAKIETGRKVLTFPLACVIADIFGIKTDDLRV